MANGNDGKTRAHRGFFPVVKGDQVSVAQAGGTLFLSGADLSVSQGGAQMMLARGNASIHQGGANALGTMGDLSINQGGAVLAAAGSVSAKQSYLGIVISPKVELSDDSKILLNTAQAAALGLAAAVGLAVLGRLFGRA